MTSCATSVRERDAEGSSLRSFVPTSPVCSITASSAGQTSTPVLAGSSTSHSWKKELTVPARSTSAGTKDGNSGRAVACETKPKPHVCSGEKRCFVWPPNSSCQYRERNHIQYIENIYDFKYTNISLSFVAARNTTSLSLFHQTTSFSPLLHISGSEQSFCGTFMFFKEEITKKRLIFL